MTDMMMKRSLATLAVLVLLVVGIAFDRLMAPRPALAQGWAPIQATGSCPTNPAQLYLAAGMLCVLTDTTPQTVYILDSTITWRQLLVLPVGVTSTFTLSQSAGPSKVVAGGAQVLSGLTFNGIGLTASGGYLATTPGLPVSFPGDVVLGLSTAPTIGPGFGGLTLRARRSATVPGQCALWAIAGSAFTETLIKDFIPGNC